MTKFSRFILIAIALIMIGIVACAPVEEAVDLATLPQPSIQHEPTSINVPPSPTLPEATQAPTKEPTPVLSPETENTLTPEASLTPTKDPSFSYPDTYYIKDVYGHAQVYYLSCESSAAVDWAWFFGVNIYESTFQDDLPRSDNPDYGYVGDFTTRIWGQIPPYSYGVHAEPIAEGLRAYELPALAVKDYSLDAVKQKLSEDKPIIAWVIGNMEYSEPVEYVDKEGRVSIVAPHEHVVILTGYNEESIRYMNNGKTYEVPTEVFLTSWGVLGNMAVIYE